jgi:hypothetical protein
MRGMEEEEEIYSLEDLRERLANVKQRLARWIQESPTS